MLEGKPSRREFIKTTAYTVPVILTLKAMPAFAQSGSPPPSDPSGGGGGGGGNGGTGGTSASRRGR